MDVLPIAQALSLVAVANFAPVVAKKILGRRWARPLDGGVRLGDGRALFGSSKTIRGIVASLTATLAAAPILGVDWTLGILAFAGAMGGDLASSFTKRRLGLEPSSQALGLDHIPESLLPLVLLSPGLGLSVFDIVAATAIFWLGAIGLSPLLHRLGLRDRPH